MNVQPGGGCACGCEGDVVALNDFVMVALSTFK